MTKTKSISERLFEGTIAKSIMEEQLIDAGAEFENLGWDHYDNSLELYDVPPTHRLSEQVQRVIHAAGFSAVYANHTDKWETHYRFEPDVDFKISDGWRVSYPHKRGEGEKGIWVEKVVSGWPKEWFETGYCIVKEPV